MNDDRQQVLAANEAFYSAFSERDMTAMDALWSRTARVACVHPGWRALEGRALILQSFRRILEGPSPPDIRASGPSAFLYGETAFVICTEELDGGSLVATNTFVREGEDWKMVHHHAGPGQGLAVPDPSDGHLH